MNKQYGNQDPNYYDFGDDPDLKDEPSLDELLEELKVQLNEDSQQGYVFPAEESRNPYGAVADTEKPHGEQKAVEFEPDFGDAFRDYGTYTDEQPTDGEKEEEDDFFEDEDYDYEDEDPGPLPKKPKAKRKKRLVPLPVKILLYIVLVGVGAIGLGYGVWECAQDVLAFGRSDEALTVVVNEGDTVADIGQMLKEQGVIKYPWLFEFYCDFTDSNEKMDPGTYVLYYNYDYHALVGGMVKRSPNRVTIRVTIPEGYTTAQIFNLMEKKGVCTIADLEECAASFEFDYWFLEDIPYGAGNRLEGFLFPDTYDFYENDDPDRVLDKILSNFKKKFSDKAQEQLELLNVTLAERWTAAGLDEAYITANRFGMYELMTVASMIEKETAGVAESGKIASVIYNRLCRPADYPYLNIDATVVYALGGIDHPLTYEDLEIDSPYNTYKRTGLPAGPISNPGLNSITAALNPTDTNYYFYALDKETGFHYFSKNASEHENFLKGQE